MLVSHAKIYSLAANKTEGTGTTFLVASTFVPFHISMKVSRMSLLSAKSDADLMLSVKGEGRTGGDGGFYKPVVSVAVIDNKAFSPDAGDGKKIAGLADISKQDVSMKSTGYSKPPLTDDNTPSIRDLVVKYASKSTVHGLPSTVAHSLYNGQRYLWFLLVLSMAVALTVAITLQLKNYYEWPTVVNIQEVAMTEQDIPEVTVCNQEALGFNFIKNPWSNAAMAKEGLYVNVQTETLVLSNDPACTRLNQSGECLLDKANESVRTLLLTSSLDRAGWFIPRVEYYPKVVTSVGVCNTFKTSVFLTSLVEYTKNMESAQVPLDIVLAIKPDPKRFMQGQRLGIQITLHTKEDPPFPRKKKVFLPVGTSCRVKYQKITRKSLTTPYKSFIGEQCVDTTSSSFRNPLTRYDVYTKDTCLEECFVNFTISQCRCRYHLHPGTEEMCSSDVVISCMETTRAAFSEHKKECKCIPPCEETEFESYLSCSKIARSEYSMVHIELMSSAEVKTQITQIPVYTIESIMGSLGGLIGLFMGFSLVSLMEFVELIFITVSKCCAWRRRKRHI